MTAMPPTGLEAQQWLARFHRGERDTMAQCYHDHMPTVMQAIGRVLRGADQETVAHDVFYTLLSDPSMRAKFTGGSLGGWLNTVARNRAIDYLRKHRREVVVAPEQAQTLTGSAAPSLEAGVELQWLVERFRREEVPDKWAEVFEARFVRQLSQYEAAAALGMHRTTLAYQEQRLRARLRRFLLHRRES
jgi:RNA polymerase sigma-70 factor (ECF subfamily)